MTPHNVLIVIKNVFPNLKRGCKKITPLKTSTEVPVSGDGIIVIQEVRESGSHEVRESGSQGVRESGSQRVRESPKLP